MSLSRVRDAVRKAGLGLTVGAGLTAAGDAYAECMFGCKTGCNSCTSSCSSCNQNGSACKTAAKDVVIGVPV